MLKYLKLFTTLTLAVVINACGGGGGSPGAVPGQTTDPNAVATQRVADITISADKTNLLNSGTDTAKITVVAVDATRNVVPNAYVTVVSDQNSIFTRTSAGTVTDATGSFAGTLALGTEKSDRTINVTATVNGISKTLSIRVTGSKLTLQAAPSNPAPGQNVVLTLVATDAGGSPLPNALITFGGSVTALNGVTATTSFEGRITRSFAAPSTAGIYRISATGLGVSSGDYQIQVFSASVPPPVVLPAGIVPALSASPNVIAANAPNVSTNRSTIRFLILNAQNAPIPNVRVRFNDATTGVPTVGAVVVNSGVTLYTDASGTVSTDYIAGQNPSPTNGVLVRACFSGSDFLSADDCPNSIITTLTVAGQALAVSIGDDNVLTKGAGTYIKKFALSVADSAGKPVANAAVDISVDLTHYGKYNGPGFYRAALATVPTGLLQTASFSVGASTTTSTVGTGTAAVTVTQVIPGFTYTWCYNEDVNRNGFADPGENINGTVDTNNQSALEPRKSDVLISYVDPARTTTNANGFLEVQVEYSQRYATWLAYRVRVIANVQGSQGISERLFITDAAQADIQNGSFLEAPYGRDPSCRNPN